MVTKIPTADDLRRFAYSVTNDPAAPRSTRLVALGVLVCTLACTPAMRSNTLIGVGAAACGAGKSLTAADVDTGKVPWDAILSGVGCWLSDWAAAREDRRREAERAAKAAAEQGLELAPVPAINDPLDQAALRAMEAQAKYLASPCQQTLDDLADAYVACMIVAPELGQ